MKKQHLTIVFLGLFVLSLLFIFTARYNNVESTGSDVTDVTVMKSYIEEQYRNRHLKVIEYEIENVVAQVEKRVSLIRKVPEGVKKNVVSYGIYGSNPKYTYGAVYNSQLVKVIYPGFIARFYVDDTVPLDIISRLVQEGAEIIYPINPSNKEKLTGKTAGMFWRFLPAVDPTVDVWLIRDTDSRVNVRERYAVDEWLLSNKSFHVMRDHPYHPNSILGGMWGGRQQIAEFETMMHSYEAKGTYFDDMNFLDRRIWPMIKTDVMAHDSYYCKKFPEGTRPFPTARVYAEHVGQVHSSINEIVKPHLDPLTHPKNPPPPACQTPGQVFLP